MAFSKKSRSRRKPHYSWRNYQASLPKNNQKKPHLRRQLALRTIPVGLFVLFVLFGLFGVIRSVGNPVSALASETLSAATPTGVGLLDKEQVRQLLNEQMFSNLTEKDFALPVSGGTLQVQTTLDPDLQNYLLDTLDRVNSRYVGIVVMEALSGRVLALAGYDRTDASGNPCLQSKFPAASIFKIVTAAAAIDQCGYSADSPMHFNEGKHTLYKRQLVDKVNRYTTTIPLSKAFADSVNPVFGKLGELRLGKSLLEQAAETFGFNQPLDFDVSFPASQFKISDSPYNWAEVASGFNRQTTLSPLHGAALAAAVLNEGRMVTQTIIERIADDQGQDRYLRPPTPEFRQIMSAGAAEALGQMMESTITSGTARKSFRGHRKDKILAPLQIGGKTGSISSSSQDVRYDWFVGFASERQSERQLVVSVMVGHEKFIGIRACDYARRAMTYYFANPVSNDAPPAEAGSPSSVPQTSSPALKANKESSPVEASPNGLPKQA
jgi:penicillin-binding protein A